MIDLDLQNLDMQLEIIILFLIQKSLKKKFKHYFNIEEIKL